MFISGLETSMQPQGFHKYVLLLSNTEKFSTSNKHTLPSLILPSPALLSSGPGNVEAKWNKIWLVRRDARRDQSACLSACKSFDPVSEEGGDLMLFRLISLAFTTPPIPPETCLCSHPAILFTAPLHAIVLMIMGVDSCLMHRCHHRCLLIAAPLHLTGLKCICHMWSNTPPPPLSHMDFSWSTNVIPEKHCGEKCVSDGRCVLVGVDD